MGDVSPEYQRSEGGDVSPEDSLLENDHLSSSFSTPLTSTSSGPKIDKRMLVRRRRRKEETPAAQCCAWILEHQIGLSVNLLLLLTLTHICFPKARRHTHKFVELSYYNPESGRYTSGWDDVWIVTFWFVLLTGLRAAVMDTVLKPMARWGGISNPKDVVRFAEQGWLLFYVPASWSIGMYIMYNSPYWLDLKQLWTDWPTREIGGLLKWYILVQFSFWLQQVVVVNIEKRRKDYWQMFSHHIVTCILIFTSYGYHQTKVANLILCLMDTVDILLSLAKCFKYLGFSTLCDVLFGLFMLTWVITRHVFYVMVCKSVWQDIPEVINLGCYRGKEGNMTGPFPPPDYVMHLIEPFRDPEGVVCFNQPIKWGFLTCLLFLEGMMIMWFVMICRVAAKVLRGGEADDVRSDDEGEDEEEEVEDQSVFYKELASIESKPLVPLEEEVGVEAINLKGRSKSKRYRSGVSSAASVTIPGHSDRKELLGRIGCDKGV